jgi:Mg2+-importing ATPase
LLLIFHASIDEFRSAWFIGSVATEVLVVFLIRTRQPFFKSRPGKLLLRSSLLVVALAVGLPFSGMGKAIGLVPIPVGYLTARAGISALYLIVSEWVKRVFYARVKG